MPRRARSFPFVKEFEDGYDTVEWAAKLPGSNGKVGMFGLSYFGKTQWQAAVMQPSALASPGARRHLGQPPERRPDARRRPGTWPDALLGRDRPRPRCTFFRKYRGEPEEIGEKLPTLIGLIDTLLAGGGYKNLPLTDLPDPDGLVPFVQDGFKRGVDDEGLGLSEHRRPLQVWWTPRPSTSAAGTTASSGRRSANTGR